MRTRALLPQPVARLVGLFALAAVGALEWQRLITGLSSGRALLWVAAALAAAVGVLAVERLRQARTAALVAVAVLALFAGYLLSGAGLDMLRPRYWDDLLSGMGGGLQALGTVRLPYASADPWPRIVLELLGAQLLILAGLLTFWPRTPTGPAPRVALASPERGYQFVALAVLFVVVASPVVSLGETASSLVLGLALAALTVVFLWLERLPLRPGLGVAGLLAVALAGALPLAAAADRGQPWFDYRSFAESLGPDDPVRFSWAQSYGPITWPRDGNEIMRVVSGEPMYWKARNLDAFDGSSWTVRSDAPLDEGDASWEYDVPRDWESRPEWTRTIQVSIRRMRIQDVIGAGTTVAIGDASRGVSPAISPGTWNASGGGLRRGDSYTARVHVPEPGPAQLAQATSGADERQEGERTITVPFQAGKATPFPPRTRNVTSAYNPPTPRVAEVTFRAWDGNGISRADYPRLRRSEFNVESVMRRSKYAGAWALSKRLRRTARYPMDYVRAVYDYLHRPAFRYVERPAQPANGAEPLEFFLTSSREGYCQHYAGAMALLLRMGGIPARVVTGFSPGGFSSRKKAWIVRDTDAHAWVEAWFDDIGWVTVDPTPDGTPARSQIAVLAPAAGAAPPAAAQDTEGDDAAGDAGQQSQRAVRPELQVGTGDDPVAGADEGGVPFWVWLLAVLGVALAVLAAALFVRRPRGNTPMDRAIAEVEDALRRVGRPVSTGTTLKQLERRLGSHSPEVAEYLHALAAGRYALSPAPPSRHGRRALRRALAQGLGFGGGLRALWALPPRLTRPPRAPRTGTLEVDTRVRA